MEATVVVRAEPVGRGLSGDGRFNRFWRHARPGGCVFVQRLGLVLECEVAVVGA